MRRHLPLIPLFVVPILLSSCAGRELEGKVGGTQTRLQDAIADGSKSIGCAPKETALAEVNIKAAEEALKMGEYYRGKEHVILASKYTEIAELKTDKTRCLDPGDPTPTAAPTATDKDGDGYDDDVDGCPEEPEDFDAYEDEDGCPDRDNDGDGVEDASEFDRDKGLWINLDKKDDLDCRNEPEDPDGFEDEDGCPDPDNDQDGLIDEDDQCPNDPEDFDQFEDEDGCPDPDNDQDGILDGDDQCPLQPEDFDEDQDEDGCPDLTVDVDPCEIKLKGKILFDSGKYNLKSRRYADQNMELLNDVVTALEMNPDITIEIRGHTDSKGSDRSNEKLSHNRVKSVRDYLVDTGGVDSSRITYKGYGEAAPLKIDGSGEYCDPGDSSCKKDSNATKERRAENRRVEFKRTDNPDCN